MLISLDKKLLFVHIQKTGGTSIAQQLRKRVPDVKSIFGTHDHARWARSSLGETYSELFRFAFVRNPWDRLVSWYSMIEQCAALPRWKEQRLWRYVLETSTSFEEFVLKCTATIDDRDGRKSFVFNQLDYVTDEDGRVIVDFIGRYENLAQDASRLFATIGLGEVSLSHANRSKHRHYTDYYSNLTREIVAERFARDIAFFNYRFEES